METNTDNSGNISGIELSNSDQIDSGVVLVSLLLTLNIFHTLFQFFYC